MSISQYVYNKNVYYPSFVSHMAYTLSVSVTCYAYGGNIVYNTHKTVSWKTACTRGGGGEGYSHTSPIWVCAAQRGRDFEAADLERGTKYFGSRLYLLLKIVADYEEAFI